MSIVLRHGGNILLTYNNYNNSTKLVVLLHVLLIKRFNQLSKTKALYCIDNSTRQFCADIRLHFFPLSVTEPHSENGSSLGENIIVARLSLDCFQPQAWTLRYDV